MKTADAPRFRGTPFVYVAKGDDQIAFFRLDVATGDLYFAGAAAAGRHPSFLAFAPSNRFAYAVNEFSHELAAFSVDQRTGALSLLNRVPSLGTEPAFVSVDASGVWLFAANYRKGPVAVFPILADGRLGAPADAKETGVHPHAILTDRSNRFAFVPNAGSDKVSLFAFDAATGRLTPATPPEIGTAAGGEPRHLAFHPTKSFVYVIEESGCRVNTFALDEANGTLSHVDSIATLPPDADPKSNTGADLHVSPSGRFLYGSNRGHDSIAIFAIGGDGKPTAVGHAPTRGKVPRNFGIDPTGTFLFAANQGSSSLSAFRIDAARGSLEYLRTTEIGAAPYWVGVVDLAGP